ncbi:MAG TPA: hypothetical protein VGM06_16055 [Polyangiaceae bacterium]|jgi:hypothetical protein
MAPVDPSEFEAFSRSRKPSAEFHGAYLVALLVIGLGLVTWYCATEILGVGSFGGLPLGVVLAVFVGLMMMMSGELEIAQRRRLRDRPLVAIREASDGLVEIRGTVHAAERGPVKAPLSERDVVWARIAVSRTENSDLRGHVCFHETTNRDFFVDDGSGERARVVGARAVWVPPGPDQQQPRTANSTRLSSEYFSDRMRAYVKARRPALESADDLVAEEVSLTPGEEIVVLGAARRVITAGSDGYRGTSQCLVLGGAKGAAGEVLIARARPADALWPMRYRFGVFLVASGTLAAAVEAVWYSV